MIFEKFSYKQKLIGLILTVVLLFIVARKRSYLVAIDTYNQVEEIENKLAYIENSTNDIASISNEVRYYDDIIGSQNISPEEVQQKILNFSPNIQGVELIGIKEIHKAIRNDFLIITNRLLVEGDYNSLLKLIYEYEKTFTSAIITNIEFSNREKNKGKISLIITFQNYDKV